MSEQEYWGYKRLVPEPQGEEEENREEGDEDDGDSDE